MGMLAYNRIHTLRSFLVPRQASVITTAKRQGHGIFNVAGQGHGGFGGDQFEKWPWAPSNTLDHSIKSRHISGRHHSEP